MWNMVKISSEFYGGKIKAGTHPLCLCFWLADCMNKISLTFSSSSVLYSSCNIYCNGTTTCKFIFRTFSRLAIQNQYEKLTCLIFHLEIHLEARFKIKPHGGGPRGRWGGSWASVLSRTHRIYSHTGILSLWKRPGKKSGKCESNHNDISPCTH